MIDLNDNDLVQKALSGDEKSFMTLFDKYQKTIFNLVFRMINSHDDAVEVTQRTFIKIYDRLDKFKPELKFFSWIYRIALNETFNFIKQKRNFDELTVDMISGDKKPDEIMISNETNEKIRLALLEMDPEYRALIVLKHIDGRSYEEMAAIVGISPKKVKSRLYTARLLLKDALVKLGFIDNE